VARRGSIGRRRSRGARGKRLALKVGMDTRSLALQQFSVVTRLASQAKTRLRAVMAASDTPTCPNCASSTLHRSTMRWHERWRKAVSERRPFRCQSCRYRMWKQPQLVETTPGVWAAGLADPTYDRPDVDLSRLDESLSCLDESRSVSTQSTDAYFLETRVDWQVRALLNALQNRLGEIGAPAGWDPSRPTEKASIGRL